MSKKSKFDQAVDQHTDHRWNNDPVDKTPEWVDIYNKLKAAIGEWPAFNWFSHCRFVSRYNGLITLENWGAFVADECLQRHGFELCVAAVAERAEVRYSGGTRPATLGGPDPAPKHGAAHYAKLPDKRYTGGFAQSAASAMRAPRPAAKFRYPEPEDDPPASYAVQPTAAEMHAARLNNPLMAAALRTHGAAQAHEGEGEAIA